MHPTARWPAPDLLAAAILAIVAAAAGTAHAETATSIQFRTDEPCVLDKCLGKRGASATPKANPTPSDNEQSDQSALPGGFKRPSSVATGEFDFYVLALSWSPGFCETRGTAQGRQQCEPGTKLGFVVHGLWPQNQHGYPSNCNAGSRFPSRLTFDSVKDLYPDQGLARHEWAKHGACTGLSPTDYFANVRQARQAVTIPQQFQAPEDAGRSVPSDIARAFVAANPRLRADMMAVTCRQNMLEEIRICFSKDLRGFVSCPEVARASCRRPIEIPPVL